MKDVLPPSRMSQWTLHALQLAAAVLMGWWLFEANPHIERGLGLTIALLLVGLAGAYAVTFVWVWIGYGWRAARSTGFSDPEARRAREITRHLRHPPPGA